MRYRIHPDTAWVDDPDSQAVQVMPLPSGDPLTVGGTGRQIYLDVVAGLDPISEAVERFDAPADEVRAGVQQFLDSLVDLRILIAEEPIDDAIPVPESPASEPLDGRDFHLLFVCTANICRSAFADARMRALRVPGIEVDSAGTHALVGHPMDPPMARRLADPREGEAHRGKQLTRELVDWADLIVAMSERHRDFILEEWPDAAKRTFLIGHVARELRTLPHDARAHDVAAHLFGNRTVQPGDSVRDPYGRGDSAAAEAAGRIDTSIDDIAAVLGQILMGERQ